MIYLRFSIIILLVLFACTRWSGKDADLPVIEKLGTIDLDIVESSPVVFHNTLYRFEYVRATYWANETGESFMRIINHDTGEASEPFARGYHLGSAFVHEDSIFVTAVNGWGGNQIEMFVSADLIQWKQRTALVLNDNTLYNTSICKDDSKFVLMYEIGDPPEEAGVKFSARFAFSQDLNSWDITPVTFVHDPNRYSAPHALRYYDGYYYNFYLDSKRFPKEYHTHVARSSDLIHWDDSPLNPILRPNPDDKKLFVDYFSPQVRLKIGQAENINNSDIDFCEFDGRIIINYSWGNQKGKEFLAEAVYYGSLAEFLVGWFPK